jgi:hypothetical protein
VRIVENPILVETYMRRYHRRGVYLVISHFIDQWSKRQETSTREEAEEIFRSAGKEVSLLLIAGMTVVPFPSEAAADYVAYALHMKFGDNSPYVYVWVNGVEREPYVSC